MSRITGTVVAIGTYNSQQFTIECDNGQKYDCLVHNMDKWDRLYDYMDERPITVWMMNVLEDGTLVVLL
jgi:hypothetical protein